MKKFFTVFTIVLILVIGIFIFVPRKKNNQSIKTAEVIRHNLSQP